MHDYQLKRGKLWYYVRRVPGEYASLDRRNPVRISTKVKIADDPKGRRAARVVERLNAETEAYWRGLVEGRSNEARLRYDAARTRARALGFDFMPAEGVAELPMEEVLDRLDELRRPSGVESKTEVAAVLGGESLPAWRLASLFDEFERLNRASLQGKSPDQIRKWRAPKQRALKNLIEIIGDKSINEISRSDALDFRNWWQNRILDGKAQIDTANKDIGHINKMMRTLNQHYRLGLEPVFADMRIEGGGSGQRQAFAAEFVSNRILSSDALSGLNSEARAIVHLVAETGLRLSEACNLTAETIKLSAAVPHICVRPDGREMKTSQSARDIPLLGVALKAMQRYPSGFSRYRHKADSLSALVNKYLDNAGLRPTKHHTLYSLRHTFEDRLTAVNTPEKVMAALMGHKYHRPKYGAGPSLELKAEWMEKIEFSGEE